MAGELRLADIFCVSLGGITRLDGARVKKQVWRPMFEPELFRKKIQRIEVSTCDIFRTFRRPILTQRPGNCIPFPPSVTPLVALLSQIDRVLLPHI